MIEIHINKDVGSYEAKFIGPFTMRQTLCVCIAAPICWLLYKMASPVVSTDVAGFFIAVPAAIAWIFGWTKPYGMRPEKFIQSVFISMILAPANRKYISETFVNDVGRAAEQIIKNKEAVQELPVQNVSVQEAEGEAAGKKKKQKKPRYKVSPDAVK